MSNLKSEVWTLPNKLSMVRIVATPILILLLLPSGKGMGFIAAVVFVAVCSTDWLDGYIARKTGTVTTLGKFLDPLADKLIIMTGLVMLVSLGRAPGWIVALIIAREIAITGLRTMAVESGTVIAASPLGKAKTVTQIVAITALILHYPYFGFNCHLFGMIALYLALAITLYSGWDYFYKFIAVAIKGGGGKGYGSDHTAAAQDDEPPLYVDSSVYEDDGFGHVDPDDAPDGNDNDDPSVKSAQNSE